MKTIICFALFLFAIRVFASGFCPASSIIISAPEIGREPAPVLFGKISDGALFLGTRAINIGDIFSIKLDSSTNSVDMAGNSFVSPAVFLVEKSGSLFPETLTWTLQILDSQLITVDRIEGEGIFPQKIIWLKSEENRAVIPDRSYYYSLTVKTIDNRLSLTTAPQPFALHSVASIMFKIPSRSFSSYQKILESTQSVEFINTISEKIRKHPGEKLNLVTYAKKNQTELCRNLFRLRNYLILKTGVPPKRFHLFCDYVKGQETLAESRFITITGTKPIKKVEQIPFKTYRDHQLTINGSIITPAADGLFLFPKFHSSRNNKVQTPHRLHLRTKRGEEIFVAATSRSEWVTSIQKGKNQITGLPLFARPGPREIYCGTGSPPRSVLKAGLGPYMISDVLSPGDFHLLFAKLSFRHDLSYSPEFLRYLGLSKDRCGYFIEFSAAPKSLTGPSESRQSFFQLKIMPSYRIELSQASLRLMAGYFFYTSNNNYYQERELTRDLLYPILALEFDSGASLLDGHLRFENTLGIIPFMMGKPDYFGFEENLSLALTLTGGKSLFLEYSKRIFRYKNRARNRVFLENLDSVIAGLRLEI